MNEKQIVACPKCRLKARVPVVSKKLRVTCPHCEYKYDVGPKRVWLVGDALRKTKLWKTLASLPASIYWLSLGLGLALGLFIGLVFQVRSSNSIADLAISLGIWLVSFVSLGIVLLSAAIKQSDRFFASLTGIVSTLGWMAFSLLVWSYVGSGLIEDDPLELAVSEFVDRVNARAGTEKELEFGRDVTSAGIAIERGFVGVDPFDSESASDEEIEWAVSISRRIEEASTQSLKADKHSALLLDKIEILRSDMEKLKERKGMLEESTQRIRIQNIQSEIDEAAKAQRNVAGEALEWKLVESRLLRELESRKDLVGKVSWNQYNRFCADEVSNRFCKEALEALEASKTREPSL